MSILEPSSRRWSIANFVPDMVALAATPHGDGITRIPGASGTSAFAVATVNVGSGTPITAFADTGGVILPLTLAICQTNPAPGACLGAPGNSVTVPVDSGATPTFAVFVTGQDTVPFDSPRRIHLTFPSIRRRTGSSSGSRMRTGSPRGATSVAVRTQ